MGEETLTTLGPLLLPIAVWIVTVIVKKLKTVAWLSDVARKPVLRVIVAVLSFGAVLGNSFITGEPIDATSVQALVETFYTFLGASGIYVLLKK